MSTSTFQSPAGSSQSETGNKYLLPGVIVGLIALALLLAWWFRGRDQLQTGYGRRSGPEQRNSVNGTFAFSEMFRQTGRTVTSVDRLSPRLRRFQTIVWFPDDYARPKDEQLDFLEQWMSEESGRTVIYVGRDYDAASAYWTRILPLAPPDQEAEVRRQLADAKSKYQTSRTSVPQSQYARWFTMKSGPVQKVTTLSGPWAAGVDVRKAELTLASRLDPPKKKDAPAGSQHPPPDTLTPLLQSGQETLIFRASDSAWIGGKVIVVNNGSSLLNYPLINKEHRKLAARLIAECPDGEVAFLESGAGGPAVEHKSLPKPHQTWPFPMNAIVFHLVALAIIFCLARAPIFGRPRTLPSDSPADFGKHIRALGKLMQRTKDQAYAYARLQQYRQHGKRDSGKSHKK